MKLKMKIKTPKTSAREIDLAKRSIEIRYAPKIQEILNNIATDASNLYAGTERVDAKMLADNYKQEFVSEIRKIYRKTIKDFGFVIRKTSESNSTPKAIWSY
jgi:hypothetical protein